MFNHSPKTRPHLLLPWSKILWRHAGSYRCSMVLEINRVEGKVESRGRMTGVSEEAESSGVYRLTTFLSETGIQNLIRHVRFVKVVARGSAPSAHKGCKTTEGSSMLPCHPIKYTSCAGRILRNLIFSTLFTSYRGIACGIHIHLAGFRNAQRQQGEERSNLAIRLDLPFYLSEE